LNARPGQSCQAGGGVLRCRFHPVTVALPVAVSARFRFVTESEFRIELNCGGLGGHIEGGITSLVTEQHFCIDSASTETL